MRKGTGIMKTPKPLLALRMVFPLAASLIVLLLGEGIARGSLSADVFASFIFPHIGAYLLAWLLLFLVWLLLDWVFRCPPLSTLGMAVLGWVRPVLSERWLRLVEMYWPLLALPAGAAAYLAVGWGTAGLRRRRRKDGPQRGRMG